jgi:GNAT superfamily N-acetyltransferase
MMEIDIRRPAEDEFAEWLPLWAGYQEFYGTDIPEETTRTTWRRFFDPDEPMGILVAEARGRLVGFVHYIFHRSCWTTGDYCYLQDLFVAPGMRGGRVGRRLIEAVYDTAREKGCSRVYWLTHETNAQARILYDRVAERPGFIQYRKIF